LPACRKGRHYISPSPAESYYYSKQDTGSFHDAPYLAWSLWDGNDTEIVDPDKLHGIEIKDGMVSCDWMSIRVLFRVVVR
jgi:hypothetical protein